MRRILVSVGLIVLWIALVVGAVLAEAVWFAHPSLDRGDFAAIERHLVDELRAIEADRGLGCAALVLIRDGDVAAEHVFGVADAAQRTPVRVDETLFLVASVSKAVTAWGVLELVEQQKLALDEPVLPHLKRWRFEGSEAYRDAVTARQLLSHTAGLDDGLGYGGFGPGARVPAVEESLARTDDSTVGPPRAVRVAWQPGRAFAYSGGGYAVLQLLIEEVSGQAFASFMQTNVLQPLGMLRSSFDLDALVADGREKDLAASYDASLVAHPPRRYAAPSAVALWTTPRDIARFAIALADENPVLRRTTLDQAFEPQPGTGGTWGLGHELYVHSDRGGRIVGHSGGTPPAFGAMLRMNPATGNGFVLLVSGASGGANQLVHDWTWWESGQVTREAREQIVQDRLVPAAVAILVGALLIGCWPLLRRLRQRTMR
jgi:CubicO group peptidase (beta-lactamase class C family)